MNRLSEQVAKLEESEQEMNVVAINLRKEINRLRLENDKLRNILGVPMVCYEKVVLDCNHYLNEISELNSKLAGVNKVIETLEKRYEEKIKQVEAIEEANTQLQARLGKVKSACKYNFNNRKVITNVNKSNNEVALLELCKSSSTSIQPYIVLSVQGTNRFVCLRKEEWEQLVKTYVKEYLL